MNKRSFLFCLKFYSKNNFITPHPSTASLNLARPPSPTGEGGTAFVVTDEVSKNAPSKSSIERTFLSNLINSLYVRKFLKDRGLGEEKLFLKSFLPPYFIYKLFISLY